MSLLSFFLWKKRNKKKKERLHLWYFNRWRNSSVGEFRAVSCFFALIAAPTQNKKPNTCASIHAVEIITAVAVTSWIACCVHGDVTRRVCVRTLCTAAAQESEGEPPHTELPGRQNVGRNRGTTPETGSFGRWVSIFSPIFSRPCLSKSSHSELPKLAC